MTDTLEVAVGADEVAVEVEVGHDELVALVGGGPDELAVAVDVAADEVTVDLVASPDIVVSVGTVVDEVVLAVVSGPDQVEVIAAGQIGPVGPRGEQGPQGEPGTAGSSVFEAVAAVDLSGHRAVAPNEVGELVYASNGDVLPHRAVWLSLGAAAAGDVVEVVADGEVVEPSWSWVPGLPVWLGEDGALTQVVPSPPAFQRRLAVAVSATALYFAPSDPIVLT